MSNNKQINTRIQHKHDIESNWIKALNFIPKAGEIIVYDPDDNYDYARIKIGDGLTLVNELKFSEIQPDWNVNNENDPAYIKNRPFYTSDATEILLVDNATVTIEIAEGKDEWIGGGEWLNANISEDDFTPNKEYIVNINGTTYNCISWTDGYDTYLGNGAIADNDFTNTGEPFFIEYSYKKEDLRLFVSGNLGDIQEYTVSITLLDKIDIIIPSKYLGLNIKNGEGKLSIVEGANTTASGEGAHAEGRDTTASGNFSHTEGENTIASGGASHAEGYFTTASNYSSHAEGDNTTASGESSHAEGYETIAASNYQHVQGKYNIEDNNNTYSHIVGNGDWDELSNAHTLDWNGNAWFAGDVYVGSTSGTNKDNGSKKLATIDEINTAISSIPTPDVSGQISAHNADTSAHTDIRAEITSATTALKNELLNGAGEAYDTLKELGDLIDNNTDALEALETIATNKSNATNLINGLATNGNAIRQIGATAEDSTYTLGKNASAFGESTKASGENSHAEGWNTTASGYASHAEGSNTEASGGDSHAEGVETKATGWVAHAEGFNTIASGEFSHAEGAYTKASEESSHAEGNSTTASGEFSHAEGNGTEASGENSHAEGDCTIASAWSSHAEGAGTTASGEGSHAEGSRTIAYGYCSHAEGRGDRISVNITGEASTITYTYNSNDVNQFRIGMVIYYNDVCAKIIEKDSSNFTITLDKTLSSEESGTIKVWLYEHVASGQYSHAEGYNTTASEESSHAEGHGTTASGTSSHAEGVSTEASGESSHAEGVSTYTNAYASHAEGYLTKATGENSHAEGSGTTANSRSQHVQGEYNVLDKENAIARRTYAHIVGNGASESTRSNAHTLDWKGNAWFAGDVYVGSTSGKNKDSGSKKLQTEITGAASTITSSNLTANKVLTSDSSGKVVASSIITTTELECLNYVTSNIQTQLNNKQAKITGTAGQVVGFDANGNVIAQAGVGKNVEGAEYTIDNETVIAAEGAEIFNDYVNNQASGEYSHAEGEFTVASGVSSHAEGYITMASGYASHVEGSATIASGGSSHAEGQGTNASGDFSHAEGMHAWSEGETSHAEGYDTIASGDYQHVQGKYNISDTTSAHIVGNGTGSTRSNAHTLDWSGNAWFAGDVYVGSTSGKNKDDGSKKLVTVDEMNAAIAAAIEAALANIHNAEEVSF